jgi:hypothetical protein
MSDDYYIEILNNVTFYLNRYGNLAICILGNIGNLLSAIVFFKKSWKKNVCVFYFLICLLLSTMYLNSTILGSCLISGFNINLINTSVIFCKIFFYIAYTAPALFPTVLILASIDRLLISSQNVDTRLYSSKRLAYFSVSISTFFWIVFQFHILIKVNIQQSGPSHFICYYDPSDVYLNFVSYSSLIFNCLFCLLMIILSIFSFKNIRRIRSIPRQQRNQIRTMTKKDFQLIRCLFAQDIVYIFLGVSANFYGVYNSATKDQLRTPLENAILNLLQTIFDFLFFAVYCTHFFVFFAVSKAFRNEIKRMVYKIFGKDSTAIRREENNQEEPVRDNIELNVVHVNNVVPLR